MAPSPALRAAALRSFLLRKPPASTDGPSPLLRAVMAERRLRRRQPRDLDKDEIFVPTPESWKYLDTLTMPMLLTAVGLALFTKLLYMHHEATEQERLEKRMMKLPPETGTVRMLTREEWEKIQEIRPRTPFESKYDRTNSRIRTGEHVPLEDMKNWAIDVLTDALTKAEDAVKKN